MKANRKRKPYDGARQALTQDELDKLFAALKTSRHGKRNYLMGLLTYRHGLRVSELIDLRWNDIDWRGGTIQIDRLKGSLSNAQGLEPDEVKLLKALRKDQDPPNEVIFVNERGDAFSRFAVNKMVSVAAERAGIKWAVHPHCLRHTTATRQAELGTDPWRIQRLMGHAAMSNTMKYVSVSSAPLKGIWRGKR